MIIDIKAEVLAAEARVRQYIKETSLDYSVTLSKESGAQVFLKCEHQQYTGSFKVRGALNKLLSLTPVQQKQGIVTASSGNHGAAVGFGMQKLNIQGTIFVPKNAASTKVDNIRNYTSSLVFYGTEWAQTKSHAIAYADEHGMMYVSPYDDWQVIGGQGTIGLELLHQLKSIDAVFVSIGGGGLISGIAGYLKTMAPKIKMIGCQPANSPLMTESIRAGRILTMPSLPTLSDATAGIVPGTITFGLCQQFIDDYILVSEEEIKEALIRLIKSHHTLVEGASAVALAAFLKQKEQFKNQQVVIVLSGANISLDTLASIITK